MTFHIKENGCRWMVFQDGSVKGVTSTRDEAGLLVQILTAMEEAKQTIAQS